MDKSNHGSVWFLHKIADCVRTDFRPYAIGDPRGRAAVRARSSAAVRSIVRRLPMSANGHCALARANRVFWTDKKRIRPENTVPDKGNTGLGLHLSKIADYVDT
jgi:hypothetical protein